MASEDLEFSYFFVILERVDILQRFSFRIPLNEESHTSFEQHEG